MIDATTTNRYASDWNGYSAGWEQRYGDRYRHLGDEWCDDGTAERRWEQRLFAHAVEPWLTPRTRALEIGPGGGKWTVRLAPRVGTLMVFDVAETMLDRTRARVAADRLSNVSFVLGDGRDLSRIPDGSIDLVFSYDVFVHIRLEDTVAYVAEIARVLAEGGVAVLHHAIADTRAAWDRIESHNDWYRDPANTLGQYYYYSRDAIERMYARAGLRITSSWVDYCTMVVTARKPADTVVPGLERALRQAALASDAPALDAAVQAVDAVSRELATRLAGLVEALGRTAPGRERYEAIQRIRTLLRG